MRSVITTEKYGEIAYEESIWTGSKKIFVNGIQLTKINKKTFAGEINGEKVTAVITGGYLTGAVIDINGLKVRVTESAKWYDYVFPSVLLFIFLIWSNNPALCLVFPVAGGAVGCGIAGGAAVMTMFVIKPVKNIWAKLGISLAIFTGVVLINFLLATVILTSLI